MLEVAGKRRLTSRVVAAGQQAGERERLVVAREHLIQGHRRCHRSAGAAGGEPPQRPQQQPAQREGRAQLKTTTPRATWPVLSAVKPSLIWSRV